jgi:hypothetical protein
VVDGHYYFANSHLTGPATASKKIDDLVVMSNSTDGEYKCFSIRNFLYDGVLIDTKFVCNMQGPDGVSPTARTVAIEGGTRVIITDKDGTKSFDVMNGEDVSEIVYFYGYISNPALFRVTFEEFDFYRLRDCINAGKTPIAIVSIPSRNPAKDSYDHEAIDNEKEYLVMPLAEWYKDKADTVPGLGDTVPWYTGVYATFVSTIQNRSYTLKLEWDLISLRPIQKDWVWTLVPTNLATISQAKENVKYFDFTVNYDIEYSDNSSDVTTICTIPDIQDAYDKGYAILAKLNNGSTTYILPLVISPNNYGQTIDRQGQIIFGGYWQVMFSAEMRIPVANSASPEDLESVYRIILDCDTHRPDGHMWRVYWNEVNTDQDSGDMSAYRTAADQDLIDNGLSDAIDAKYTKPLAGIPASDLASAVQTSLGKADTALQSVPSTYRTAAAQDVIDQAQDTAIAAKYTKPSGGIPNSDLAQGEQRGYTSEERVTLVPEGTYTFVSDGGGYAGYVELVLEEVPEIDPLSLPAYVTITVDGVAYEKEYNESESDNQVAVYGDYFGTETVDCALTIDLDKVRAEDPTYCVGPIVQFAPDTEEEQHTFYAYFIKQPVTTTPDFDAAVAKSSAEALAEKLDTDGNAYRAASIPMGQLDSSSTATVMTATVPGITELRDGVCVWLKNGVITSASGFTLNINSLGAKPCYSSLAAASRSTTIFNVNYTMLFVYNSTRADGGCWDVVYGVDTNTTYTPAKLGQGYAVCSTAAATVAKTASISSYALTAGGIVAIKFAEDVPANATLNISSKGAKQIYYRGAAITAGVIKAGDTVTMIYSTYYHVLSIDRDIPSPAYIGPPAVSYGSSSIGVSAQFARSDHTHELTTNTLLDVLLDATANNVPVFLYDGQNGVYISKRPQDLANAFQSQTKMNFALVVPPNYNSYPVLFTPSKFDTATGELHLTGITGGVLYEATLLPDVDPTSQTSDIVMVGTMTTTDLALPSAQGVSF